MPRNFGTRIDRLLALRKERQALTEQIDAIKKREAKLVESLVASMRKADVTSASSDLATFSFAPRRVGKVQSWEKVYSYIKRTGKFELLQRRLSQSALDEIWESKGRTPAGIQPETINSVSLTQKRGKK